jgi:hypothetical protein
LSPSKSNTYQRFNRPVEKDGLTAIADRGYFNSPEIQACHEAGIDPIVAKSLTSVASADGRFGKADFIFDAKTDTYLCPARQTAIYRLPEKNAACSYGATGAVPVSNALKKAMYTQ